MFSFYFQNEGRKIALGFSDLYGTQIHFLIIQANVLKSGKQMVMSFMDGHLAFFH